MNTQRQSCSIFPIPAFPISAVQILAFLALGLVSFGDLAWAQVTGAISGVVQGSVGCSSAERKDHRHEQGDGSRADHDERRGGQLSRRSASYRSIRDTSGKGGVCHRPCICSQSGRR